MGTAFLCEIVLVVAAFGQTSSLSRRVEPTEAKHHIGETATVCGKVVDTKVSKYGIAGHGKPITLDIDQPDPNPIFNFVTFPTPPETPADVVIAYQGKRVCGTGKIASTPTGPYIMAADRSQIKTDPSSK